MVKGWLFFPMKGDRARMSLLRIPIQHDKRRASYCNRKVNTMNMYWKERSKT